MFPIIEVEGSPRNRGQQHGVKARKRIDRSVATYARLFAFCGIDWKGAQQLGAGYRDHCRVPRAVRCRPGRAGAGGHLHRTA